MAEESWLQARLIPTSGINGASEQERRATSALLAVMTSVREFGMALTRPLGAPVGHLDAYIEVPFHLGNKQYFPDGLIRIRRGKRTWTALVEVKTGNNDLDPEQIEHYVEIARREGYDAVLTLSNEVPAVTAHHPSKLDRRKLGKVRLHHLSWTQVLTEAVMQKEHRGVADPDQAWILGELIRYLEHPRSGALEFNDMGAYWVAVRDGVANGTLRPGDDGVTEIAGRFDALLRHAGLRLGRQLGTEVTPVLQRKELTDPVLRTQALVNSLTTHGLLNGAIRVPGTVGPLALRVDLRARTVACQVDVDAPRTGRGTTRVNWLVRQLRQAPDSVCVEAFAMYSRGPSAADLLRNVRENPRLLVPANGRELSMFRITMAGPMGIKRGSDRGSFIKSVLDVIDRFYAEVHQHIRAWTATPLSPRDVDTEPVFQPISLSSTALSPQDGTEPEDAALPAAEPVRSLADESDGLPAGREAPSFGHPLAVPSQHDRLPLCGSPPGTSTP